MYGLIVMHHVSFCYAWPHVAVTFSVSTFRKSFSETEVGRLTDLL